jgi:hypothetical protein
MFLLFIGCVCGEEDLTTMDHWSMDVDVGVVEGETGGGGENI